MTPDELKAIRHRLDLTQDQMAKELGLSLRAYAQIELGQSTLRQVHALAALQLASGLDSVRVSPEVAAFYRALGGDWQTRINDTLRGIVKNAGG